MTFKEYDKVEILGKSTGCPLSECDIQIGDIGYIGGQNSDKEWKVYKNNNFNEAYWFFETDDLVLVSEFRENDRVKVLEKSIGVPLGKKVFIGDYLYVKYTFNKNQVRCVKNIGDYNPYWDFLESDLTLVEQKEIMYESLNPFYPMHLLNSGVPSLDEKKAFLGKMYDWGHDLEDYIEITKDFINYFTQHSCFERWLIEEGYIRKIVKEVFEPFVIEIPINCNEDYENLYHRLNAGKTVFEQGGYNSYYLEHIKGGEENCWKLVANYAKQGRKGKKGN